jgi:hypothetical protein
MATRLVIGKRMNVKAIRLPVVQIGIFGTSGGCEIKKNSSISKGDTERKFQSSGRDK